MLNESESSASVWASVQDAVFQVLQIIDLRLALVIALAVFTLAVAFDSAGNPAAAADLVSRSALVPVQISVGSGGGDRPSPARLNPAAQPMASPNADSLATARRLRHGGLTSPILTNNRLTEAHFFTDLPTVP